MLLNIRPATTRKHTTSNAGVSISIPFAELIRNTAVVSRDTSIDSRPCKRIIASPFMQITKNSVVMLEYTLRDETGQVLDSTEGGDPLQYLHGSGMLIPGLESALEGKSQGDAFEVTIPPEDAYGVRDDNLRQEVDRAQFAGVDDLAAGMKFRADAGNGELIVLTVAEVDDDKVIVDGNHEMAGKTLNFNVTVGEIREATAQELAPPESGGCGCGDTNCDE